MFLLRPIHWHHSRADSGQTVPLIKTASVLSLDNCLAADVCAGPVAGVRLHGGRVPPHEAAQQHQRLLHPQLCATPQGRNPPSPLTLVSLKRQFQDIWLD
jgi:hypothetical protein